MNSISNDKSWKFSNFIENKNFKFDKDQIFNVLSKSEIDNAYQAISNWEDYSPTPLISLNKLSKDLGLKNVFYKDESKRFNLKSFKALGGAYAVEQVSKTKKNITVATATAGNHGRSVAWGAKRLGLKCKIFISEYVSENRAEAMRGFGAEVFRVKGNYDNSLKECINQSKKIGKLFKRNKVPIDQVLSSQWCRCKDTAKNAFGEFKTFNALNSFFSSKFAKNRDQQMKDLKSFVKRWNGKENIIFVTHYVVIGEALNTNVSSGEIAIADKSFNLIGTIETKY